MCYQVCKIFDLWYCWPFLLYSYSTHQQCSKPKYMGQYMAHINTQNKPGLVQVNVALAHTWLHKTYMWSHITLRFHICGFISDYPTTYMYMLLNIDNVFLLCLFSFCFFLCDVSWIISYGDHAWVLTMHNLWSHLIVVIMIILMLLSEIWC